jgi:hypothetical protein
VNGHALKNEAVFNLDGFISVSKIQGDVLKNTSTMTINTNGTIDTQNAINIPGWFIHNTGTLTNHGLIRMPTVSTEANISDKGINNELGATIHNYKTIQLFGQMIMNPGLIVNHAPDGLIEGDH